MPKNDEIPTGPGGPDEDKWNVVLDEAFVRGASIHEPAAPGRTRVLPIVLGLCLLMGALALVTLKMTDPSDEGRATASAKPRQTASAPGAAAPGAPSAPASGDSAAAGRPMVPLADVFPAEVPDGTGGRFTRVGAKVLGSCTEPDSVGPRLAAMIAEGKGCVGEQVALYKDAQNNQFNIAVFTMKDPKDTLRVVTELSMAFDDYQVGVQAPPAGSGLATLGPETGLVQSFTGVGRVMVVGLGQWSDGRTADFQKLVDRLGPLQGAVGQKVNRYEGAGAP
ncbi:hypothetical protein AB0F18_37305 [Streptomyces sp. NPDC029216]|uniref:SCO2583/SCO2584 N-terminal domain-containing protein n=1 Tax=Streptomyces sp. NPDC029216 TaxID=3154701 RepID=UPI0033D9F7EF